MQKTISAPCGITSRQFVLGREKNERAVDVPKRNFLPFKFNVKRKSSSTARENDLPLLCTRSLQPGAEPEFKEKTPEHLLAEGNNLSIGYISSPLNDFRHTAHLGAKGESSGDLAFLELGAKRTMSKTCGLEGDVTETVFFSNSGNPLSRKNFQDDRFTEKKSKIDGMKEFFTSFAKSKRFSHDCTTSGDSALDTNSVGNESSENSLRGVTDCEIMSILSGQMATSSEIDGLLEEFIEAFNMTEQRTRKEVVAKRLAKLK